MATACIARSRIFATKTQRTRERDRNVYRSIITYKARKFEKPEKYIENMMQEYDEIPDKIKSRVIRSGKKYASETLLFVRILEYKTRRGEIDRDIATDYIEQWLFEEPENIEEFYKELFTS